MKPNVLILTGYGVNCEAESAAAWDMAGARAECVHLHDLLDAPRRLHDFQALMLIGGFSFGDHMGSGHVFALRLRQRLREPLRRFIADGRLVLGVCNGFQIMIKLGLLPALQGDYFTPQLALMPNDGGVFQNFWVTLRFEPASPCVFTRGLAPMPLPIRHGEGKLFTPSQSMLLAVEAAGGVACRYVDPRTLRPTQRYPYNPNGSLNAIAGLSDPTGRVFGLMPHPEAYLFPENHPDWPKQTIDHTLPSEGLGLRLFKNAVSFLS